jgi:hypothetical protein
MRSVTRTLVLVSALMSSGCRSSAPHPVAWPTDWLSHADLAAAERAAGCYRVGYGAWAGDPSGTLHSHLLHEIELTLERTTAYAGGGMNMELLVIRPQPTSDWIDLSRWYPVRAPGDSVVLHGSGLVSGYRVRAGRGGTREFRGMIRYSMDLGPRSDSTSIVLEPVPCSGRPSIDAGRTHD